MRRTEDKSGKWPDNCPTCGCPNMNTRKLDGTVVTQWAYEAIPKWIEDLRVANAVIDDAMPAVEAKRRRDFYDTRRELVAKWCEDTNPEVYEEDDEEDAPDPDWWGQPGELT